MIEKVKNLLKKLYSGLNMSWKNVIIFAVIAGVYTGLVNSLPFLDFLQNTSFTDIAVTYEWWIFFAVIIAANCKKPLEAGLKVFIFFLISQPLVYLVEVPFKGFGVFAYYNYWFYMTLLTFPGAMAAYYGTHKNNILSTLIMCVATVFLCGYIGSIVTVEDIGRIHYLTLLFCLAQVIIYIFYFIRKTGFRVLAIVLNIVAFALLCFYHLNKESQSLISLPVIENWENVEIVDGDKYRVVLEGSDLKINFKPHAKNTEIILTTDENEKLVYDLSFSKERILQYEMRENNLTLSIENLKTMQEEIDNISWPDFDLYERTNTGDNVDDLAVYEINDDYNLVLSGRDGDVIQEIYLVSVKEDKKLDFAEFDFDKIK